MTMARFKIGKGTKAVIKMTAKDELDQAIDITAWTKFGVVVFREGTPDILFRVSSVTTAGWKDMTITNGVQGEFEFIMEVADTKEADPGNYNAELIRWLDDNGTPVIHKTPGGMEFMELFESPTAGLTDIV